MKIKLFLTYFFSFQCHFSEPWEVAQSRKKLTNQKSLCEFVLSSHTYWKTLRFRRRTPVGNVVVSLSICNILFSSVDWERKSFEKLSFLPQFEKNCYWLFWYFYQLLGCALSACKLKPVSKSRYLADENESFLVNKKKNQDFKLSIQALTKLRHFAGRAVISAPAGKQKNK